ncbi:unnamed protein product [Prorocentrum cordatum]|uniref:Strictosidine synthase conserved region domain-containing protein n=1 Tax=Prorocentrum cordatum TaxID=2364126 RepID=A0ABN9RJP7_9DINO|nr:unnamed protein product [Polarella glacialis]
MYIYIHTWLKVSRDRRRPPKAPFGRLSFCQLCTSADGMMRRCTSHSVGALLLLLVARGAPSARSPASGTLARPRLEGSASGRPREPQAEFGRRQATSGAQLLKLLAGDGVAWNGFGKSVAVSSDGARVVVGADCYYNDDRAGSAYVLDGATGERLLKLVASDGAVSDKFGISVAVTPTGPAWWWGPLVTKQLAPRTCSTVPPARGCSSLWRVMGPLMTDSVSRWP